MKVFLILALTLIGTLPAQSPQFDQLSAQALAAVDGQPQQAVVLFKQALALHADWAEGWLYMGASLYQLRRFAEAADALGKGAALAPKKGTPRAFIGLCEFELADYDASLLHILQGEKVGLADNPTFIANVHYHAALIYIRRLDFRSAVEQLQPLSVNAPPFPDIFNLLGAGVLQTPVPLPKEKVALAALTGRAVFAFYAQRPDEAKAAFAQLAADYPKEPGVHYAEGVYLLHDDPDKALTEFQKELEISPASVLTLQQIALLLIKNNRSQEALELARRAVRLAPANVLSQIALGRALLAAGNVHDAIAPLERALKLAPDAPQLHFYLAQAYRRDGRQEEALREQGEFKRLRELQDPLEIVPNSLVR
jgi:predicted Zn-dependent protease